MKVLIKKSVWNKFLRENKSSRGDTLFNNTTGFYGNFGSVKSFNADNSDSEDSSSEDSDIEDVPLNPNPQMAVQISVDEPPVDDPDYIPVTKEELGLAAARIAKEVPSKKIEFFYRKLHKLLDAALDEDDQKLFQLQEAIDYSKIHPMHHKAIQDLIAQVSGGKDRKGRMSKEDSANFVMQNRIVRKYPDIMLADVIDEIEKLTLEDEEESEEAVSDAIEDYTDDILINPPGDLKDISPHSPGDSKTKTAVRKTIRPKKEKPPKVSTYEDINDEYLSEKAQDELNHLLASAYSEYTEMNEYAQTWDWTNYQEEAPYLKVIYDLIIILHQLSYRVLQSKYITKYGGYVYDPEADVGKKQKGGFVLLKQGPTSRPEAEAMLRKIHSDFGLTYEKIMRQQNILKIEMNNLTEIIERAMIGIFQRLPSLYSNFINAVQQDISNRKIEGSVEEVSNEAFSFIAQVLAHKYKGESGKLDRDLVNISIAGIFKRCLLDLPIALGLQPTVSIAKDRLGKKKAGGDKTYGFNLAAATRRFESLRRDPKIAKAIKKLLPPLILKKITETKTAKVTFNKGKYNFEDISTGLGYELISSDLKKKINEYVESRLEGVQPSFDEEQAEEEADLETGVYDAEQEEKEAKARLSKDDYETRKMVQEMEKMIASGDWMHIAPLFGFSGAPGVRQWYLRYPERKFMIMTAARSENAPGGARRYLEVFRKMRENLGNSLITLNQNQPGVLDLMIDELANKGSLSTSEQAMIDLLEEMRNNIEDLLNLYEDYNSYEELEEQNPEELQRLSNTPGGSLLRFGIGSVFDRIIKDMDTEWHAEMKAYLETKNGLKEKDAHDLAYYFTGLKNKPSKGDFSEDKEKLSNAAAAFVNVGMEAPEFFEALRYSQGWFFSTLDRELNKDFTGNSYYKMIHELTSQPLYKKDKQGKIKLDKKVYSLLKKLIDGKNGAISAYLDNLAIEQFQQETQKKINKVKSKNPDVFN